jgi:peptidoglycan/xylan/chitin deacetylase (PgdA/CDA1 family)
LSQRFGGAILHTVMTTARPSSPWLVPFLLVIFSSFLLGSDCNSGAPQAAHLSSGCSDRQQVALTFDDGPNPPYTQQVLDILRAYDTKATFFVEGEAAAAHPDLVRQESELGMAVGSHSYAHSEELVLEGLGDFEADLKRAEVVIEGIVRYRPRLYRAPYGHTSEAMLRGLYRAGYVSIGWDIDSEDWSDVPSDQIVENVLSEAHPGAIVLLHDGGIGGGNPDRTATVQALPRIIDGLRQSGYELVTVPDLTGIPVAQDGSMVTGCSGS